MTEDLYAVLGVPRDAPLPDIKKAFRDLARRYHPDKNPGDASAEARFKIVAEAYRVLGDADLRSEYDRSGTAGGAPPHVGGDNPAESAAELFEEIFGTRAARFQRQQHTAGAERTKPMEPIPNLQAERDRERARPKVRPRADPGEKGYDLRYTIELNFEDAALGCEKKVVIPRIERCDTCAGTGARPGSSPLLCQTCGGNGTLHAQQGFFALPTTCPKCDGAGKLIPQNCPTCQGSGQHTVERAIPVKVPAGVDSGTRLKLKGEGNPGPGGGPRGDLYVVVNVRPHAFFRREEEDVVTDVPVSFAQAALGGDLEIPTLEGRMLLRIPAGSQTGRVFRLKGKGIPSLNGPGRGDQRVRIFVETPTTLSDRQRAVFEELARIEHEGEDESSLVAQYRSSLKMTYE